MTASVIALGKTPVGRRARGRMKTIWRTTVEKEMNMTGWKSWNAAQSRCREDSFGLRV